MKYSAEELASMAKEALVAIQSNDLRGIILVGQLAARFRVDGNRVIQELQKLAAAE